MEKNTPLLELALTTAEACQQAQEAGANRIELCQNLAQGGTTPSAGTVISALNSCDIPIHVLIRPRPGDFCYSQAEVESMIFDIVFAHQSGANGVVIGALDNSGHIDADITEMLVEAAEDMSVTFHRAFDWVPNPLETLNQLKNLGIERVLTSGQAASAWEGRQLLQKLVKEAGNDIAILAGAGVKAENAKNLVETTGVSEIHFSAMSKIIRESAGSKNAQMGSDGEDAFLLQFNNDKFHAVKSLFKK